MWLFILTLSVGIARAIFLIRQRQPQSWRWWLGWGVPALSLAMAVVLVVQDLELQKFIGRLLMPLGLLWLGFFSGAIAACCVRRWWLGSTLFAGFILVTVAGSTWVGNLLMRGLETGIPRSELADLPNFQAIFVLGGGTSLDANKQPQLGNSGDRLVIAARLFRLGKTPLLISSGTGFPGIDAERDIAAETAHLWRELGIPREAIEEIPGPINTKQEITAYRDLCHARGWTHVAVISSAWHLPRAMRMARSAGFNAQAIGADWRGGETTLTWLTLMPTGLGANEVQWACWEWLGSFRE